MTTMLSNAVIWIVLFVTVESRSFPSNLTVVACEGEFVNLRARSNFIIKVLSAQYGRISGDSICNSSIADSAFHKECESVHVVDTVKAMCENMTRCHFAASPELFGNPCPMFGNYLKMVFTTERTNTSRKIICSDESVNLSCNSGEQLEITEAVVRRAEGAYCPGSNPKQDVLSNVLALLKNSCGKGSCDVMCDYTNKTEPRYCMQKDEYIDILYKCTIKESNTV